MIQIHHSWEKLKPKKFADGNIESFEHYYIRIQGIKRFHHIPKEVFKQWLYAHHDNPETLKNYAWINYYKVEFRLTTWSFEELSTLYVIKSYRDWVNYRNCFSDFGQFGCNNDDLIYWKENWTWKTPPVIIDLNSINCKFPKWSELEPPFQLVEGHTRFGLLFSTKRISDLKKGNFASNHLVYVMKQIEQQ